MYRSISGIVALAVVLGATTASAQTYTKRGQGAQRPQTTTQAAPRAAVATAPAQPRVSAEQHGASPRHHGHWQRYYQHDRHHHHRPWFGRWW